MLCIISTKNSRTIQTGADSTLHELFFGGESLWKIKKIVEFPNCEPLNRQFQKSKEENQIEQCNLGFSNNNCLARETCPNITCREGVGGKVGAACPNIPLEGMAISYS